MRLPMVESQRDRERWWPVATVSVLAVTAVLTVSGVGYLLLSSALTPAAFVSGPLLLLWVTGAGISLGRSWEGDR